LEDLDGDGIQDVGEPGVNGVVARLYDVSNPVTAIDMRVTTTDELGNDGYYMFDGVIPGAYYVTFELPNGYIFTTPLNGNDVQDSNVDNSNGQGSTGTIFIGQDEILVTIDAGIYQASAIGNYVFIDEPGGDMNRADGGDTPLADVQVVLWDADNNTEVAQQLTDDNGQYLFVDIAPGNYYVEFNAPGSYTLIAPNIGTDDTVDSDADPITGLSQTITINPGDTNLTIDAGFAVTVGTELITFDGEWNDNTRESELFWIATNEVNVKEYIVERSDENNPAFKQVKDPVDARGTNTSDTTYDFYDDTVINAGTYYYRLQIVDNNGDMSYSDVIAINVTDVDERPEVRMNLYPHAAVDILNVEITSTHRLEVSGEVYDMKGALIAPLSFNEVEVGETTLQVDVNNFPGGAYIIRLKVGNKVFVERFTKLR